MKTLYFIEVTDTFGGEANYAWVIRHVIKAKSLRGAVNAFSRSYGISWHSVGDNRYDSKSGSTCFFIEEFDEDIHGDFMFHRDDRS